MASDYGLAVSLAPKPFSLRVAEEQITDLKKRIERTRWPDQAPDAPWAYGTDVSWLKDLVSYWADGFDWRKAEHTLNAFPHFKVGLGGIDLHYIHVKGKGPDPIPLLISHGWPGSVFEMIKLIPRLTDPKRFGGNSADAFTVIAPSLPGFGLSFAPGQRRLSHTEIADLFAELMIETLGYERFGAHGGDWGAYITAQMAYKYPARLIGIHLTWLASLVASTLPQNPSDEEQQYAQELAGWHREGRGYATIQGTRPQTLAFGLTDSPAGLAAWIGEKFHTWSDGGVGTLFSRDDLLANISLYWFTGAINSSFWPYYARHHGEPVIPAGARIDIPAGYAAFPKDILRPPRSLAAPVFTNLRQWTVMERGGHFAALEQPEMLAREIANFFRPLRTARSP